MLNKEEIKDALILSVDAECDDEGSTPKQNEVLDAILDKYTQKIYETINAK